MNVSIRYLGFCLLAIAASLSTSACAADTAGMVKLVKGEVTILRDGSPVPAAIGATLSAADQITTGPESAVGILLEDGTQLSFGPNSIFHLDEFRFDPVKRDGNLFISLLKGSMRFVTGLLGKAHPDNVSIRIPTATIGIRGTDFVVSAN